MNYDMRLTITLILVVATVVAMLIFKRRAIPCYVAIWLFMPHKGQVMFGYPPDIPQFLFVELAGAFMLVMIALMNPVGRNTPNKFSFDIKAFDVRHLLLLVISLTVGFQLIVTTFFVTDIFGSHVNIPSSRLFSSVSSEIAGVCFLFASTRLVKSVRDIEMIMKVFIFCGLSLLVNFVLAVFLPSKLGVLAAKSFNENGLFFSFFLNDYILVGIVCGLSSLFCIYFSIQRKSVYWRLLAFIIGCMVFVSFKRSVIVAFLVALFVFFVCEYLFVRRQRFRNLPRTVVMICLFALTGTFIFDQFSIATLLTSDDYLVRRVLNYRSSDSVLTRLGIQLRGLEVVTTNFPFGVGNDMLRFHMAGDIPANMSPADSSISEGYYRVVNGSITESHNGYLEQIASYGLLGFISMFFVMFIITRNLIFSRRCLAYSRGLYSASLAMAALIGIFYIFLGYPRVYIGVFLLLQITYVLRVMNSKLNNENLKLFI
ncbi:MAG: O-antigen ligase family protein [Bacteroidota bacterium]|nr:O-antigen ligase family protein [Bacteroidota bacterium]